MTSQGQDAITIIPPRVPLIGRAAPPGSKSITNRALLLAALARGTSRLTGALKSDDTRYMAEALRQMGIEITEPDATSFTVTGTGRLLAPKAPLFLGNAGTATRFLTAAVAMVEGEVVVTGDEHMQKRPIAPLIAALKALGVEIEAPTGCPPVTLRGKGGFSGQRMEIDGGLSSQYVSALLMLAAQGHAPVEVALTGQEIGAKGYIDLTLAAMRVFGAKAEVTGPGTWLVQPGGYHAAEWHIEPDASAATYFWAAEALSGGKIDLGVEAEAFTQPDAKSHAFMAQFPRMPAVIDGSQMQDAVPTLAVLAAFNEAPVRFTGIANLRVKECDRLSALATEMGKLGLAHEEGDELIVTPRPGFAGQPVRLHTYADHRMAMSLALLGLRLAGVTIEDPGCVAKTFPEYWQAMAALGLRTKPA
ncbi:3-phosphoshikimate 1-carboxyvinyltransferase [Acetobacteraceae bacterium H6797]|nr:3-phosphoshikimate 1-carboxyvinyltransferase [Acetobacteraceae bacterium H6797]